MKRGTCLLLAVVLAGCARSGGDSTPVFNNESGMQEEYRDALGQLSFPDGFAPPSSLPPSESGTKYEPGFGVSQADFVWLCAWFGEFMSSRGTEPARAEHALDVLSGFPSLELWAHMDGEGRQTIVDDVNAARNGDVSGIERQQEAMVCSQF